MEEGGGEGGEGGAHMEEQYHWLSTWSHDTPVLTCPGHRAREGGDRVSGEGPDVCQWCSLHVCLSLLWSI